MSLTVISSARNMYIYRYTCVALWKVVCGASATERSLGTIGEEKGISSRSGCHLYLVAI